MTTASSYLVCSFGEPSIWKANERIVWAARSAEELFWFLFTFPEGKYRHQILGELWNLEENAAAGNRFRVALHRLRAALGWLEAVTEKNGRFQLHADLIAASDIAMLYQVIQPSGDSLQQREQLLEGVLQRVQGEYLPQLQGEWIEQARSQHRATIVSAYLELAQLHCQLRECPLAAKALTEAIDRDPLVSEDHHQRFIACLSMTQDRYAALEHYRRYRHFLLHEVGDTPLKETERLIEGIKAGKRVCEPIAFHPEGK